MMRGYGGLGRIPQSIYIKMPPLLEKRGCREDRTLIILFPQVDESLCVLKNMNKWIALSDRLSLTLLIQSWYLV